MAKSRFGNVKKDAAALQRIEGALDRFDPTWRKTIKEIFTLKGHTARISSVAWSPDGGRIVSGSADKTAKIWDADKGKEVGTLSVDSGMVTGVTWSPNGKQILISSIRYFQKTRGSEGTATLWEAEKGQLVRVVRSEGGGLTCVAWSPDGKRILSGTNKGPFRGGTAELWDPERGQKLRSLEKGHFDGVDSVGWSPDGKRFLTCSAVTVYVWDAEKERVVLSLKVMGNVLGRFRAAWCPESKRILTGSEDGTARMWDADTGKELLTLWGHTHQVTSAAWSPDGKRIVTGSQDSTVKVWMAD